ncbi:MAG: hypothetical protein U0X76_10375 [Bacteroidia bacterium]
MSTTFDHRRTSHFRSVRSITVNTVHGRESTIEEVVSRLNPPNGVHGRCSILLYCCGRRKRYLTSIKGHFKLYGEKEANFWDIPGDEKSETGEVSSIDRRL